MPYFGLKKYENGPTGPKFKHLVRKGLFPDEPEKAESHKDVGQVVYVHVRLLFEGMESLGRYRLCCAGLGGDDMFDGFRG